MMGQIRPIGCNFSCLMNNSIRNSIEKSLCTFIALLRFELHSCTHFIFHCRFLSFMSRWEAKAVLLLSQHQQHLLVWGLISPVFILVRPQADSKHIFIRNQTQILNFHCYIFIVCAGACRFVQSHREEHKCKHMNNYTHTIKHRNFYLYPLTFTDFLVSCCNFHRNKG